MVVEIFQSDINGEKKTGSFQKLANAKTLSIKNIIECGAKLISDATIG